MPIFSSNVQRSEFGLAPRSAAPGGRHVFFSSFYYYNNIDIIIVIVVSYFQQGPIFFRDTPFLAFVNTT